MRLHLSSLAQMFSSLAQMCVAAFVTFHASHALAAAKDETYSAYAAQNQVTDAILSRDGTTFMTFAAERGRAVVRGWRIAGSDAAQIGRIEIKDHRTPARSRATYPFSDINKDFASFKKSFALSPSGDRVARLDCGHVKGMFDACELLIVMDWRGKTVASIKDTKKDLMIVPGTRPCGIAFSPDGRRLYVCTEAAMIGFGDNSTITYHDEFSHIHVFDAQLKRIQEITLGPTARSPGAFPGRAQIEAFSISSDNMMLVSGYAYATTNTTGMGLENETQFDKSDGHQIWRVNLDTGAVAYHYDSLRPANAEAYAKTGNYLDITGGSYAALVGQHVLRGYDNALAWEGEVFGEAKKAKRVPSILVSPLALSKVSDDGRILFGYAYNIFPSWWIVGPGAGPVVVRQNQNPEDRPANENILAVTLAPGSYKSATVTNRRIMTHDAPADDVIAAAAKYAEAVDLLEVGFTEAGIKGVKDAVSAMPPGWVSAASRQILDLSHVVMRGERSLPQADMGDVLRHSAMTFHARYKQDNATSTLADTIYLWNDFGLHAALAGNPIVVRQAADKLEPLIAEWQTRKAGEPDRDAYNDDPVLLRGLAVAIEKSPDSAYDYLLTGTKLNKYSRARIYNAPSFFQLLYSNVTKLAYLLTDAKIEELEQRKPKTPPPAPSPYPDVDGKLIPALTVFQSGAAAVASQPGFDPSADATPSPSAPGGQVLD